MKVVLFCGGFGMRMRGGASDALPKPMQLVGSQPLLWHVMRYYAHFGHTEFILCLGYGADRIKQFFLDYRETSANDFRLHQGEVELLSTDMSHWDITFVNTGLQSGLEERLLRVRPFLEGEEMFLANYADVLCDVDLNLLVERMAAHPTAVASLLAVPPQSSFHVLEMADAEADSAATDGAALVSHIRPISEQPIWENGGYLVLRQEIFDWLKVGENWVDYTFANLAAEGRMRAQRHTGFWKPADTFKERAELDEMWTRGERPWAPWEPSS